MIFGTLSRSGDKRYIDEMMALSTSDAITQFIPADKKGQWCNDKAALIQHTIWNTKESLSEHCPTVTNDGSGLVLTAWARIDNRDELGHKLGINSKDTTLPDSHFILESYKKWGEDCVHHLIGDFVFVIYDQREQKLFCARDHMGVRPFYYHLSDGHFIFASGLNVFVELPGFDPEKSQKWMAEYMLGLSMSFTDTAYTNIQKLAPAHCLTITENKHHLRQYFKFSPETSLKLNTSQEYVDCYREQLEEAVRCRLRSEYKLGVELSGGLDSSTITAVAANLTGSSESTLSTFSFAAFKHEKEYIEAVNKYCKIANNYLLTHTDYLRQQYDEMVTNTIGVLGYPVEHQISIGHIPCYQKAKDHEVRVLLSGFGGDEFVTNPASLVLTELASQWRILALYKSVSGNTFARLYRITKLILKELLGINKKFSPLFYKIFLARWQHQVLQSKTVDEYHLFERFIKNARFDAGCKQLNAFILGNRWLPFVTVRMENCSLMAAANKMEYAWPLLDIRLVKLYLSIPSTEKYKQGIGRWLHRKACSALLPGSIVWKNSKFMGEKIDVTGNMNLFLPEMDSFPESLREIVNTEKLVSQFSMLDLGKETEMNELLMSTRKNINRAYFLAKWH